MTLKCSRQVVLWESSNLPSRLDVMEAAFKVMPSGATHEQGVNSRAL